MPQPHSSSQYLTVGSISAENISVSGVPCTRRADACGGRLEGCDVYGVLIVDGANRQNLPHWLPVLHRLPCVDTLQEASENHLRVSQHPYMLNGLSILHCDALSWNSIVLLRKTDWELSSRGIVYPGCSHQLLHKSRMDSGSGNQQFDGYTYLRRNVFVAIVRKQISRHP